MAKNDSYQVEQRTNKMVSDLNDTNTGTSVDVGNEGLQNRVSFVDDVAGDANIANARPMISASDSDRLGDVAFGGNTAVDQADDAGTQDHLLTAGSVDAADDDRLAQAWDNSTSTSDGNTISEV